MRLAYVCADPGVPVFGRKGCSIHVQEVLRALARRGVEVELFAARTGGPPPAGLEGIRIHRLRAPDGALKANRTLDDLLERHGPFDGVYERFSLWNYAAMEYARAAGIPRVLEVNAPLIEEQARYRELGDRSLAEQCQARCFAAAGAILAVSRALADFLESHPSARGRVRVVANGVDPERFRPDVAAALPASDGVFTVGFVGSLKPWHGLSVLIDAFDRLRRRDDAVRLLVVGDGPGRPELESAIHGGGLADRSIVTGAVDAAKVPGLFASMDVTLAPYPPDAPAYFSPLKVLESMAAGVPVVGSRLGSLSELLEEGRCGLLVEPGDPEALAEALLELRRRPERRAALARAAREKVLREHTWDRVADRVLSAVDELRLVETAP